MCENCEYSYAAETFAADLEAGSVHHATTGATFRILDGQTVEWLFFGRVPLKERAFALAGAKQAFLNEMVLENSPVRLGLGYISKIPDPS